MGIAKGYPAANSRHVKMNLTFPLDLGKGPTMSMANFSPRSEMISDSTSGTLILFDLVNF